jgi:hypothetical protein
MYPPTDQLHGFLPHVFHTFHAMSFATLDWCPKAYTDTESQVFTAVPGSVLATMTELAHVIQSDIQVSARTRGNGRCTFLLLLSFFN